MNDGLPVELDIRYDLIATDGVRLPPQAKEILPPSAGGSATDLVDYAVTRADTPPVAPQ